jgi:hypothetical protein
MRVYVLCPEGQRIRTPVPDSIESAVCWVKGNNWMDARARALEHGLRTGCATIGITTNGVEYNWRPHWNGKGPQTIAGLCNEHHQTDMWLTMEAWARKHGVGHVYVPPLAALRGWDSMRKYPHEYENNPVPPLVAVYKGWALLEVDRTGHVGAELCEHAHKSITLGDYFYYDLGKCPLDERGSMKTWRKSYERAIACYL